MMDLNILIDVIFIFLLYNFLLNNILLLFNWSLVVIVFYLFINYWLTYFAFIFYLLNLLLFLII
jgi:hypothetical protein